MPIHTYDLFRFFTDTQRDLQIGQAGFFSRTISQLLLARIHVTIYDKASHFFDMMRQSIISASCVI